ncbi:hypothetical protein JG688_00016320 [Phytophthora aleatoria]|uniref:Uncharacterized protein n=1 Tax=Phytophthora aleatoria TaxID=2496075 RepID=A0A8J5IUF1_9STRA|nr:hypothetical protein JG688_00016320 [Phytophthora aleatoria]
MARAPGPPDITKETRQAIALYLAERSVCGRIRRDAASTAANCSAVAVNRHPNSSRKDSKAYLLQKKGDHQLKSTQLELRDALLEYPPSHSIVARRCEPWPTLRTSQNVAAAVHQQVVREASDRPRQVVAFG